MSAETLTIEEGAIPTVGSAEFAELCRRADRRNYGYRFFKRLFDIVFSALVIVIGFIPCAILALVVAVDTKGSPIYSQERVGRLGKSFKLFKFRTMVVDADNVEKYLSAEQLEQWHRERKVDNDPRITKFGNALRKTSLDELPQFVNVFFGQMSVVGPRVISFEELSNYSPEETVDLLSVPQGITGPWQAGPRNLANFENGLRQEIELVYAKGANLQSDVNIFFNTFRVMFVKKNGR